MPEPRKDATGSSTAVSDSELYTVIEDFQDAHLAAPPQNLATRVLNDHTEEIESIRDERIGDWEARIRWVAALLDSISRDIYYSLRPAQRPPGQLIFERHDAVLRYHPHANVAVAPHVVGTYCAGGGDALRRRLPWHRVETLVAVVDRPESFAGYLQWTEQLLEARPDCPGIYGVVFSDGCDEEDEDKDGQDEDDGDDKDPVRPAYRVLWADAAGIVVSPWYAISSRASCVPLLAYVYSLYHPPRDHSLRDPSVLWAEPKQFGRPTWTVKCGRRTYAGCTVIHTAPVFDRRTVVFEYRRGNALYVIKDSYWDTQKRQEEAPVLRAVHKKGVVPGVVRLHHHEMVVGGSGRRIFTPASRSLGTPLRTRNRIVLASTGSRLVRAKTVKDLLMAIYDVNEAHRYLVLSGSILHRDMSMNNILMYPEHDGEKGKRPITDPPVFISKVLREKGGAAQGLIIDFDNSVSLCSKERRFRAASDPDRAIATPCFAARSCSSAAVLRVNKFASMPELDSLARARYVDAYSQEAYDAYTDRDDTWHGVPRALKPQPDDSEFEQRADHDVESIFWSLVYTLMQLQPAPADGKHDDVLSAHALFTWTRLRGHTLHAVEAGELPRDSRDVLFAYTVQDWRDALHPRLASLAPLLTALARQVHPEYALLACRPAREHLHEAVRRLLLAHIVGMEDPIALDTERHRSVPWEVNEVDLDDTSNWRAHWIPELEITPGPEEKPKIMLRVRCTGGAASKRKRRADGDEEPADERTIKSPSRAKRQKVSH